jgi:hypothetical protein
MALDLTTFDKALKVLYTDQRVENMVYQDNPLLAIMSKWEKFKGKNLTIPIIYGTPQGRSATFATAQSRGDATTVGTEAFVLTRVKDYSIATLENEVLRASEGDEAAFLEAAQATIDGSIHALTRSIAVKMYRSGWGDIGRVGTIDSATKFTLLNLEDVCNFEVGQQLKLSASQSGAILTAALTLTVTAVNRSTGQITTSTNTGIVANDYVFVNGDRQDSATPSRLAIAGLEAWIPATDPTSTAFFGADRSIDVTRLGGMRYAGTGLPIEEVLIEGAMRVGREGHKLTHYFMPYSKYSALEKALGSKVHYVDIKVTPEVGFRGIMINGPRGPIKVVPDQNCPADRIFGLNMDHWKLYTLGKAVGVIDTDGLKMLRQASSDGVEVRYGFYGNIACNAPGANINIQV